ncbi:MAG: hypothetical protein AAF399_04210 [Bacteroidota bacterium]
MRSFFSLLIASLVLLACQPTASTESSEPPESTEPPQWVSYEGGNGPGAGKHVVLISGDEEYRSEEALPQLARILSEHHGYQTTVLFAQDPADPGVVKPKYLHNIPGLEALESADLMVMFTRFRELPDEQMQYIDDYLKSGKPVMGFRTATHAFHVKDTTSKWFHYGNFYEGDMAEWAGGFGRLVLGERWVSHHGHHKHQSTRGLIAEGAETHPILTGINSGDIWGATDVYGVRLPLSGDGQPLVMGQVVNRPGDFVEGDRLFGMRETDTEVATTNPGAKEPYNPNDPMMPVAWIRSYQLPGGQSGTAFASTMGASTDLLNPALRRLFVNAAFHLTGVEVPADANVALIGTYDPTAYSFMEDEYWEEKALEVATYLP